MLTLDGEEKAGRSLKGRIGIVLFVIAGIFVPAVLLPKMLGSWFVANFFAGLVVGLPALALLAFLSKKSREIIRPKFSRFSKEAKKK